MKTYTNGQRPMKMYGGGMASPRPPMMSATEKQRDRQQSKNVEPAMGMPRMSEGARIRFSRKKNRGAKVLNIAKGMLSESQKGFLSQLTESQVRMIESKVNQRTKDMPFAYAAPRNQGKLLANILKKMMADPKNKKYLEQKRDAAGSAGELR
jgi:hypothetical protein